MRIGLIAMSGVRVRTAELAALGVRSSGLAEVQVTVLTPFPSTPLYARLRRDGRLLTERFWVRCTLFDVNFRPARMTVEELARECASPGFSPV